MKTASLIVGALLFAMAPALAETPSVATSPPGTTDLTEDGSLVRTLGNSMQYYCVWRSRLYSVGAVFCTERSAFIQCVQGSGAPAVWHFDRTGDCDPNPALTPN
jgi:hypothetical protein